MIFQETNQGLKELNVCPFNLEKDLQLLCLMLTTKAGEMKANGRYFQCQRLCKN